MATATNILVTTGRRKTAAARVRLIPGGTGKITVNDKDGEIYLYDNTLLSIATLPLRTIETTEKFDIVVRVSGGGPNGQATAISHGLARALQKFNPEWRSALKKAGLLTRDPRERERKKSGQPGARKRFQFSKR
jgi:small subunit ribosomal protein S9